jgi:RNA polymerase sigma factor (sigma-70 family)
VSASAAEIRRVQDALPRIIWRWRTRYPSLDRDEMESIALVGLAYAVQGYDPGRGAFTTLATRCILNEWGRAVQKSRVLKRRVPGGRVLSLDDRVPGYEKTLLRDVVADPADCFGHLLDERQSSEYDAELLLKTLPGDLGETARLYWLERWSLRAIGKEFGVTGECVRQRLLKATALLRKWLGEGAEA